MTSSAPNFPRILILGRNGQVGWELSRALAPLGTITSVDVPQVDLADPDSLFRCVRAVAPHIIVNAAAYTAVDKAESEPELAMKINGIAPGILAEEAKRTGALLVHYSTDYVFDGTKAEPYLETDHPNPLSTYGRTKQAGDQAVQQVDGLHLIFRLCWVYGARGHNFLRTIQRLAGEREELRVVRDQVGCPTWCRLIAETTAHVLACCLFRSAPQDPPPPASHQQSTISNLPCIPLSFDSSISHLRGIYHLAASGSCSWHDFASAIVRQMPPENRRCHAVAPITTAEYPTPARRPANSVLNCDKLHRTFGLRLPPWDQTLSLFLEQ